MIYAANILLESGVKNILIKGGHRNTRNMEDVFLNKKRLKIFKNKKIKTKKYSRNRVHFIKCNHNFFACGKKFK